MYDRIQDHAGEEVSDLLRFTLLRVNLDFKLAPKVPRNRLIVTMRLEGENNDQYIHQKQSRLHAKHQIYTYLNCCRYPTN